jgi:hypothetical protein
MPFFQDTLNEYKNRIFVETGTHMGDGIIKALNCGFEQIFSIELSENLFNKASEKFSNNPNVMLFLGDSAEILPNILKKINEPVTFWLDAHYSEDGISVLGNINSPLMLELEAIKNHHIKTHTILIDDLRCWKIGEPDKYPKIHSFSNNFNIETIKDKLREINSNYYIYCIEGHINDDVLVAKTV